MEAAHDRRVVEPTERVDLALEAAQGVRVVDLVGPDDLHHDRGVAEVVEGQVGLVRGATPEQPHRGQPGGDLVTLAEVPRGRWSSRSPASAGVVAGLVVGQVAWRSPGCGRHRHGSSRGSGRRGCCRGRGDTAVLRLLVLSRVFVSGTAGPRVHGLLFGVACWWSSGWCCCRCWSSCCRRRRHRRRRRPSVTDESSRLFSVASSFLARGGIGADGDDAHADGSGDGEDSCSYQGLHGRALSSGVSLP